MWFQLHAVLLHAYATLRICPLQQIQTFVSSQLPVSSRLPDYFAVEYTYGVMVHHLEGSLLAGPALCDHSCSGMSSL